MALGILLIVIFFYTILQYSNIRTNVKLYIYISLSQYIDLHSYYFINIK